MVCALDSLILVKANLKTDWLNVIWWQRNIQYCPSCVICVFVHFVCLCVRLYVSMCLCIIGVYVCAFIMFYSKVHMCHAEHHTV